MKESISREERPLQPSGQLPPLRRGSEGKRRDNFHNLSASSRPFAWPIRVYWEDTDAGGVVYHARYLHFLERARSEWLRAGGIGQQQLREEDGIAFVVHRMEIAFNMPARLDDLLLATVATEQCRSASFVVHQQLRREPEQKPLVEARVRIACIDAVRFRPRPIPDHLLQEIVKP